MVNVGATRFRGRRVALRSVEASPRCLRATMATSARHLQNGRRSLPANSDPFCQRAHLADRAFLQGFARDVPDRAILTSEVIDCRRAAELVLPASKEGMFSMRFPTMKRLPGATIRRTRWIGEMC